MGTSNGVVAKATDKKPNGQKPVTVQNGKPNSKPAKQEEVATTLDASQLSRSRLEKKAKLYALYQDVEQLEEVKKSFEGIQNMNDIRITISYDRSKKLSTHRDDTAQAAF